MAVVVDAKNDAAKAFYQDRQFAPFPQDNDRLYLPMRTIEKMLVQS